MISLGNRADGERMEKKRALALFLAMVWWTSGWVCIDWVLNYSTYQGMITDLWLMQIPFTSWTVLMSPWQAYYMSILQIHAAYVLTIYALNGLFKVRDAGDSR